MSKPTFAFYMGYSEAFNGQNYNSKNIYGSELSVLKLAESLRKKVLEEKGKEEAHKEKAAQEKKEEESSKAKKQR